MISHALQKTRNTVWVYNDKGKMEFSLQGTLLNYTGSGVSVRPLSSERTVYTYDSHGKFISSIQQ